MCIILCSLIFYVSGIHGARLANVDINRIQNLPSELSTSAESSRNNQIRRSLETNIFQTNDYDDYSGRHTVLRSPSLHATKTQTQENTEVPIKIHQPKEDPKLYYQSEAYLKENIGKNVNNEVSYIYPGREVIMADEDNRPLPYYMKNKNMKQFLRQGPELCIKCPSDRTLITKAGSDRVRLMHPRLTTCTGKRAPKSIRFVHMYGARFGALVKQGSHVIIGRITRKQETLQHCKLLVHVIVQSCPVPKYLKLHCDDVDSSCKFSCRNRHLELSGGGHLKCNEEDMKWNGTLPTCTAARKGCYPLPPPEEGHISCTGDTDDQSYRLKEGSRCRLRCPAGWRWYPRGVAMCRHGNWTNTLQCQPKLKSIESVR